MKFIWTLLKSSQEWMSTVPARHNGIVARSSTSAWRRMSCISAHWPSGFSLDLITLSGAVKLQILQQPCVTAASNHRPEFSGDLTQIYLPTSPYVFRYSWSYSIQILEYDLSVGSLKFTFLSRPDPKRDPFQLGDLKLPNKKHDENILFPSNYMYPVSVRVHNK